MKLINVKDIVTDFVFEDTLTVEELLKEENYQDTTTRIYQFLADIDHESFLALMEVAGTRTISELFRSVMKDLNKAV